MLQKCAQRVKFENFCEYRNFAIYERMLEGLQSAIHVRCRSQAKDLRRIGTLIFEGGSPFPEDFRQDGPMGLRLSARLQIQARAVMPAKRRNRLQGAMVPDNTASRILSVVSRRSDVLGWRYAVELEFPPSLE